MKVIEEIIIEEIARIVRKSIKLVAQVSCFSHNLSYFVNYSLN